MLWTVVAGGSVVVSLYLALSGSQAWEATEGHPTRWRGFLGILILRGLNEAAARRRPKAGGALAPSR